MSLSTSTLRSSPYSMPPPNASTCRLGSRPTMTVPYSTGQAFSSHLHQHYSFNPNSSGAAAGFTFQNSMLLPPGSQASGSGLIPIPPLPAPSSSISTVANSMPLPDSPVSVSPLLAIAALEVALKQCFNCCTIQSQDSNDALLSQNGMPRRHSVSSHGSPIPPGSPILEEEHASEQYKICSYRSAIAQTAPPLSSSLGMNTAFSGFPSGHSQSASLQMHCATGMGYHNAPTAAAAAAAMCPPTSMYAAHHDNMYNNGTSSLMWK